MTIILRSASNMSSTHPFKRVTRILAINPNSSQDMSKGMATAIKELQLDDV